VPGPAGLGRQSAGNLVEDPELRFTNTGIPVSTLRVAVTQRIQQDGQWRDGETSFLRVNVWRGQAEHLAKLERAQLQGAIATKGTQRPPGYDWRTAGVKLRGP
jgi:single-strand DNA-binding protein